MARLLMVESWLGSTGVRLPQILGELGHTFVLATRDPALYRSTGEHGGEHSAHPALADAEEVIVAETNRPETLAEVCEGAHRRAPFAGVLTTCDYYLGAASVVARRLGLPGGRPEALAVATDKYRVRRAMARAGLPGPRFALVVDRVDAAAACARLGFPLVAKPVALNSGTLVRVVHDDRELYEAMAAITAVRTNSRHQPVGAATLVEEVLTGPEVSVETVTWRGRTTVLGITDKSVSGAPGFVETGHMFPAELSEPVAAEISAFVRAALAAIGYDHGLAHVEVMLTPAGPRIVEINPRQGGNFIFDLVEHVTGRSTLNTLVDLALGADPAAPGPSTGSAAVQFVLSPRDGTLLRIEGADDLTGVVGADLASGPRKVRRAVDNEQYVGHVMTVDRSGPAARQLAEAAVAALKLVFDDGEVVAPAGLTRTIRY